MVGIFIFPAKPNKDYLFYKEPRKVLEMSDDEIISSKNSSKGIFYNIHYDNEWEGLTDSEVVEKWNEKVINLQIQIGNRKSGLGYTSVDKTKFIRIIRK